METLLLNAEKYAFLLLTKELSPAYLCHNMSYTQRVVNATKELIQGEGVSETDANILLLAAWFHNLGYVKGKENHEEKSVQIATNFLEEYNIDESIIDEVSKLIRATKMSQEIDSILEGIIRDADCFHFSGKGYSDSSDLLREELHAINGKSFTDAEWIEENIAFLSGQHHYYTKYAQEHWQQGKDRNIAQLFKVQKKLKQVVKKNSTKKEAKIPEQGIETMCRALLQNHSTLSTIADTKAYVLLSVNAIMISLVLFVLLPKLDNFSNQYLIVPTIIFIIFTVVTIVLSVIATLPSVTERKSSKKDVKAKKGSLLFFGNFHKMSFPEFECEMGELMKDQVYLYSSMIEDLYFLGQVLHRKQKFLRSTYLVFIVGIIISVLAFGIAFKIQETGL